MLSLLKQKSSQNTVLSSTITIVLQVLGAMTLPLGKWVVDYVQKNHDVSLPSESFLSFLF
jgi:hypothetical protein